MADDAEKLRKENEDLKREVAELKKKVYLAESRSQEQEDKPADKASNKFTSFVVLGASGDLAKKKTFPALFGLYVKRLLPENFLIVGYARTHMSDEDFRKRIGEGIKKDTDKLKDFLDRCHYFTGAYDHEDDFAKLDGDLTKWENNQDADRVWYFAIPPSVFLESARGIRHRAMAKKGWNRAIIEKPFGRDTESSKELGLALSQLFTEDQIYRIDHYLGKELVQNLMILRFGNLVFEPLWNRNWISNVQITFKEDIGTEGRGGYFDEYGIIRDVMQNHLIQLLALVAMEAPVTLHRSTDVEDAKVQVLKAIPPIDIKDVVIGQFGPDKTGKNKGYLDDKTVPKGSLTPTFASAILWINNPRWKGVPFILKCGKGLNERKAEIRIQFHMPSNSLFHENVPNELVLRVQPNEAIYFKLTSKKPGLTGLSDLVQIDLDMTYKSRLGVTDLPDAYERLILDALRGDHNLFVKSGELESAWKIFTPLLHHLDQDKVKPEIYEFGTRGPASADELAKKAGFIRTEGYAWVSTPNTSAGNAKPPSSPSGKL